jgi:hypothetical protein
VRVQVDRDRRAQDRERVSAKRFGSQLPDRLIVDKHRDERLALGGQRCSEQQRRRRGLVDRRPVRPEIARDKRRGTAAREGTVGAAAAGDVRQHEIHRGVILAPLGDSQRRHRVPRRAVRREREDPVGAVAHRDDVGPEHRHVRAHPQALAVVTHRR